jgi:hypothetical protein
VDIDKYPNYNERENWWKKQEPDRWDSRVEYPRSKRSRTSADRAATELRKKWQT